MHELVPFRSNELKIPNDTVSTFHYLINHRLCSKHNIHMLRDRIKELYIDMYTMNGTDFDPPSLHEIASEIDYENMLTIQIFYKDYGYHDNDVDRIVGEYTHYIGSYLDVTVEEVLQSMAYPYRGSVYGAMFSDKSKIYDESQYVIFPEFL